MMLNALLGRPRKRADDGDDPNVWRSSDIGSNFARRVQTLAGTRVDEELALTYSAVWCATRIITEAVAGLPLHLFRRTTDDGRERATDEPLFQLLDVAPNPEMSAGAFREGRTGHQVLWGQGFAEIERSGPNDDPVALWPIHPSRVRPTWVQDGIDRDRYPYMVRNTDTTYVPMKRSEMLHIPGVFPEDSVWGKGVIAYARESIGGAQSVDRHGYAYFGSGAQPKGVVKLPAMLLKDKEQRAQYRKEWKDFHGSPDSNEVMLMPPEGDYAPIPISNEDSQFLQTRKFNVTEIARWFRVPAHMVGEFEKAAAYASVEAQGIEFVKYSLSSWIARWEWELNLKLLPVERRSKFFFEHNLDGLLRGDLPSRMTAYHTGITTGIYTLNEVRKKENLKTVGPAGDVNYVQLNMTTAQAMHENPPQPGDPAGGKPLPDAQQGPPTQPAPPPPKDKKKKSSALTAAARGVLVDVLKRFGLREADGAKKAAKGDFDEWAATFYVKHQEQLAAALRPAHELLTALSIPMDCDGVAARACRDARLTMEHSYNSDTPERFAARLAEWPTGFAETGASSILGEAV